MSKLKTIAISILCMFSLNANAYGISINISFDINSFLEDFQDQICDLSGTCPRDLSGFVLLCRDCETGRTDAEIDAAVAIATNEIYGETQKKFPFAQRTRPFETIGSYAWRDIGVRMKNGTILRVSSKMDFRTRVDLDRGERTIGTVTVRGANNILVTKQILIQKGVDAPEGVAEHASAQRAVEAAYAAFADVGVFAHNNPYFDTNLAYYGVYDGFDCLACFAEWY